MEIKQINQLMLAMRRTGLRRLKIKENDFELELELDGEDSVNPIKTFKSFEGAIEGIEENPMKHDFEKSKSPVLEMAKGGPKTAQEDPLSLYVTSPMVGTFYLAASPKDKPYVAVGDKVEKNSVVCIVEAMKVLNEIKSQVIGTIQEVLIENGSPVEFGTKLFRVVP